MKLSNSKSYKLFTVIIAISILPGCVSDTGADDGGFPYPEDL